MNKLIRNVEVALLNKQFDRGDNTILISISIEALAGMCEILVNGQVSGYVENFKLHNDRLFCDALVYDEEFLLLYKTLILGMDITTGVLGSRITKITDCSLSTGLHKFEALDNNLENALSHDSNYVDNTMVYTTEDIPRVVDDWDESPVRERVFDRRDPIQYDQGLTETARQDPIPAEDYGRITDRRRNNFLGAVTLNTTEERQVEFIAEVTEATRF